MITKIENIFLKKEIEIAPSKSFEQRVLCASLLSNNDIIITNYGNSEDVIALRNILKQFNSNIIENENNLKISTKNIFAPQKINANESAFIARVFPPIMSLFQEKFEINGQNSLLKRNIAESYNIFKEKNWNIKTINNNLPAIFSNAKLFPEKYTFNSINTSQIITGLIFALSQINGDSEIEIKAPVSLPYIYLTISILEQFNIKINSQIKNNKLFIFINGNQKIKLRNIKIEGDWSSATNMIVWATINRNTNIKGLNNYSLQADKVILDIIENANGKYFFNNDILEIKQSNINSFEYDITQCPDIFPALITLALFAKGKTKIYGINRLNNKESSRGEVLLLECQKMGAKIQAKNNFFEIEGQQKYKTTNFNSYNDHRIAMAEFIIASILNNKSTINNIDCVKKSCPNFLNNFDKNEK